MDISEKQQPKTGNDAPGTATEAQVERTDIVDTKEAFRNTDHDDAADLFAGAEDSFEYTDKEASWVRWKLDLILLTMVFSSIYLLQLPC
jgi:ACS family allantoate permease-like MFS transporter